MPAKLGFRHEATLRRILTGSDGSPRDAMIWALLADEHPGSPAAAIELAASGPDGWLPDKGRTPHQRARSAKLHVEVVMPHR